MMMTIRESIVKGLKEYTGLKVIDTDSNIRRPAYPYFSFKFTSLLQNDKGRGNEYFDFPPSLDKRFKYDHRETLSTQPYYVISFNAYSEDIIESQRSIQKAWDWFRHAGYYKLWEKNFVVVDVGDITDRTVFKDVSFEYRYGFDLRIRYLHEIDRRTETIETYKINKGKDF
ncbi:Uncharacterised protein [Anaerococcus prevotii]|nr:hypothetical protein [Anaerococcus prevotii]SUU94546.1 Uncharacterised protein [Anaerococcus prevotii]